MPILTPDLVNSNVIDVNIPQIVMFTLNEVLLKRGSYFNTTFKYELACLLKSGSSIFHPRPVSWHLHELLIVLLILLRLKTISFK